MRLACSYLEGKAVDTVTPQDLHSAGGPSTIPVMPADATLRVNFYPHKRSLLL